MASALLARRALGRHLFVLVVVAGCLTGGVWQIARLHQVEQYNALVVKAWRFPPEPLSSLTSRDHGATSLLYRRVTVRGDYDTAGEVVLYGRELDGANGNDVMTPMRMSDGQYVLVDRGWVPFDLDQPPVRQAAPPSGPVTLTGVLYPSEVKGPGRAQPRVPGLTKIDLARIGRQFGHPVLPVYLWLQTQAPRQPGTYPRVVPLPVLGNGPHLSYAIQWFIFASVGIVGYPIFLRRELYRGGA